MTGEAAKREKVEPLMYYRNIPHIKDELRKLDLRLRRQVLRFRLRMQAIQARSGGQLYISHEEVDWLLSEPGQEAPVSGDVAALGRQLADLEEEIDTRLEASMEKGVFLTLPRLADIFSLSYLEMEAVMICLAPELDRRYDTIYAYLQDDITRKKPSVDLVLDLLCETPEQKWKTRSLFARSAPLFQANLLQAVEDPQSPSGSSDLAMFLKLDRRIVDFILRSNGMDERLYPYARLHSPECCVEDVPVAKAIKERLHNLIFREKREESGRENIIVYLHGPRGGGRRKLAQAVCGELHCPLLTLDMDLLAGREEELATVLGLARREGLLSGGLLYLANVSPIQEASERGRAMLKRISQSMGEWNRLIFMAGEREWQPEGAFPGMEFVSLAVPVADVPLREMLWQLALAEETAEESDAWPAELARRYAFTPGQIEEAAAGARSMAHMRGKKGQNGLADYFQACRRQSHHGLAEMAVRIEPGHGWESLVLPAERLEVLAEICDQVKHRYRVYGEWGFDRILTYGKGLSVLITGPPGTGKTLAAEVCARELELDLYKIDLSGVVSKYIGETEKNLNRIFREAERSNAILFFDEADALFGKRTEVKDAHDRYANIETSYLLQKMEEYEGMVILATNLRANMDEAFTRRIRFVVEFPFPDAGLRTRIWQCHFPRQTPVDADIDFESLGARFQIAGGNIRNIVVNAAFLAAAGEGKVTMEHIRKAVKREYEKIGKLWRENDT